MITAALLLGAQALMGAIRSDTPRHWHLLSPEGQAKYMALKKEVGNADLRYQRHKKSDVFRGLLNEIMRSISGSPNREIFGMVCGISFNGPFVARDTRTLASLLCMGKSAVNAYFQKNGYVTLNNTSIFEQWFPAISKFPLNEQKHWILQQATDDQTAPAGPMSSMAESTIPDDRTAPGGFCDGFGGIDGVYGFDGDSFL
jgi:hypothetical protein